MVALPILPPDDVGRAAEEVREDLERWRGGRLLLTGATGFLGRWIRESLLLSNRTFDLDIEISVLSRTDASAIAGDLDGATVVQGDIRQLPELGTFDLIVHGAANSSAEFGKGDGTPRSMFETIVGGTQAILACAELSGARVLFLSSGAVYGPLTAPVAEDWRGGPDVLNPLSAYGEAKRAAENLCAIATAEGKCSAVVARLFAFVGPGIPLRRHYAAGNFIHDALMQQTIMVHSDGRSVRSYLYAGDLPHWCFAIASRGQSGTGYNVGSPEPISVGELAERVARLAPEPVTTKILKDRDETMEQWYVPVVDRAALELDLWPRTDLDLALAKTIAWYREQMTRESPEYDRVAELTQGAQT